MTYTIRVSRDAEDTTAQVLPDAASVEHEVALQLANAPVFIRIVIETSRPYDKDL
jgi:hypothetical protein